MKKFFLTAVVASLFSITAQAAERPASHYQRYRQPSSYTRASESRSSQNYQRQQYRQPSYYPQKVQRQPAPDYRYQQFAPSFYDTIQIRPVIGIDYVYSMADLDVDVEGEDISDFYEDKLHAIALSIGFKFNQYFGLEAFYQQSEKADKKFLRGVIYTENKYKAYGLDAIGYLPIAPQLDLIGSLGVAYYKAEVKFSAEGESLSGSKDKIGFRAGAGFQYNFSDYLAFRLMARYNYVNIKGDFKGADVSYKLDNIVDVTAGIRVYF